jgi:anti-sigma regulatory factor (Ser/Thr protein kinase)
VRRIELPPKPSSPSRARDFLRELFERWEIDGVAKEDGALLVTEIVTNAILHAKSSVVVEISRVDNTVEVAVTDSGGGVVRLQEPEPDSVTGRGLRLVDRLSSKWSVTENRVGKTVRFTLNAEAAKTVLPC